jgi:hypothetical protein
MAYGTAMPLRPHSPLDVQPKEPCASKYKDNEPNEQDAVVGNKAPQKEVL